MSFFIEILNLSNIYRNINAFPQANRLNVRTILQYFIELKFLHLQSISILKFYMSQLLNGTIYFGLFPTNYHVQTPLVCISLLGTGPFIPYSVTHYLFSRNIEKNATFISKYECNFMGATGVALHCKSKFYFYTKNIKNE